MAKHGRDSKGRFKKGRRGTRGFGSIISIRRGMGAIPGGAMGQAIIPGLVGAAVTLATALGIRYWVDPNAGRTQQMLVKWGWAGGWGAGILASLGLLMLGGTPAAVAAFVAATGAGLAIFGSDMLLQSAKGPSIMSALLTSSATTTDTTSPPATEEEAAVLATEGVEGLGRYRRARRRSLRRLGTGAIVPEYGRGMGAVVMEPVGRSGRRAGTIGSYGETVSLQGINTSAFGTPGFNS